MGGTKPLSWTEASCGPGAPCSGAPGYTRRDRTASQESHSLIMLTFVFRLYYESFALYASDKSAFGKRQLSIYDMPLYKKRNQVTPPHLRESTSACKHDVGLSQPFLGTHSSTGTCPVDTASSPRAQLTLECHCEPQGNRSRGCRPAPLKAPSDPAGAGGSEGALQPCPNRDYQLRGADTLSEFDQIINCIWWEPNFSRIVFQDDSRLSSPNVMSA